MLHPTIEHEVCSFDLVQATDALLGIRSKLAWELSKPKGTHNAERVAALVDQLSPATLHLEDVAWRLGRRRGREE
ncbi:MAG: hypothetical protein IVW52_21165, partial [Acidimicrobiales bacterium]|nr:hypothetical protein [Acidimicrobiales bacterium]